MVLLQTEREVLIAIIDAAVVAGILTTAQADVLKAKLPDIG